jgi:hypothetical protein
MPNIRNNFTKPNNHTTMIIITKNMNYKKQERSFLLMLNVNFKLLWIKIKMFYKIIKIKF